MRKVKEVKHSTTNERLEEITGKVIHSELTILETPRSRLHIIGLDNFANNMGWDGYPAFIKVGDTLRCFYEKYSGLLRLRAYEILNGKREVLFRASDIGYCFVEE